MLLLTLTLADNPIIKIVSPIDDDPVIAYRELTILGELRNANKLTVNGYKVQLERGLFRLKFKFSDTGYREFVFKAENDSGRAERKIKVVSLETFPDIKSSPYQREIEMASTLKYMGSYLGTDFFRPRSFVRKADMARLLLVLKGVPSTLPVSHKYEFRDLPASHWAAPYIQLAIDNNLISPMSPIDFGPNRIMTRIEILSLLRRFYKFQREESRSFFKDLNGDTGEERWISALAGQGALPLAWIQTDTFFPNRPVTREELASLLCRMESIALQIRDQFGFEFRRYKKSAAVEGLFDQLDVSFRTITHDVFVVECTPPKDRKPMFVEFQLMGGRDKSTVLLMDDGQGSDLIAGDRVFSGVINLARFHANAFQYIYKLFDDYNLIYKVGEGKIRNDKGLLVTS
jgi:hypothetical protein